MDKLGLHGWSRSSLIITFYSPAGPTWRIKYREGLNVLSRVALATQLCWFNLMMQYFSHAVCMNMEVVPCELLNKQTISLKGVYQSILISFLLEHKNLRNLILTKANLFIKHSGKFTQCEKSIIIFVVTVLNITL